MLSLSVLMSVHLHPPFSGVTSCLETFRQGLSGISAMFILRAHSICCSNILCVCVPCNSVCCVSRGMWAVYRWAVYRCWRHKLLLEFL